MDQISGGSAFRHGVASGDPTSRRVVIWTRVSGASGATPVPVRWRILEDPSARPAGNGQSLARPETDWTVSIDIGGLRADTPGMPHLRYIDLYSHGYSIVDLNTDRLRFEWWTVDGLEQRVPGQALAGAMAVRHGEARLVADDAPAPAPATPMGVPVG